jgi:hypothetical protein
MRARHLAVAIGFAVGAFPSLALADDTIKTPGDHPKYAVELEPHGLIGFDNWGDLGFGFGAGLRASIPLMANGFVPKINNTPAITFGFDWLHFESGCYYNYRGLGFPCATLSVNTFYFPVGLQWNFFVAKRWSVFAEIGAAPYYRAYSDYCAGYYVPGSQEYAVCQSSQPNHFSVTPWADVGGRFHFNEHVALTMRIGYPSLAVGVSFLL